ncbi:CYTH domain-containing protein [Lactobacillus corticis]|uniref:Adenylate cyclase n=1 Tax=Lactobacillus corticis TaxID=2201249 RepID=A0A916QFT4_9LACO|nr:CYTH domain-containing protein [Lactobacillus corticis]GFZ26214.1 adenylate cyclase [Lactobacillus corticis]
MSQNLEIEAKILLTKPTYQKILSSYPVKASFNQQNFYFETPDSQIRRHGCSLRIRLYSDRAEATLKVPDENPQQAVFHEALEINSLLDLAVAQKLLKQAKAGQAINFPGPVGDYLKQHFANFYEQLRLATWSKTLRKLLSGPHDTELTLDQTQYPDSFLDYELEIENNSPEQIKQVQTELKQKFGFTINKATTNQSKIGRAFIHR